jgi:hypothetical protein
VPPDAGADAQQAGAKRRAAPDKVPAQDEEEQDDEEDRRSYSVSPVEPDAEINLASSLLWEDYHETLAQFLSRLFQEIAEYSAAERVFRQRKVIFSTRIGCGSEPIRAIQRPGLRVTSGTTIVLRTKRTSTRPWKFYRSKREDGSAPDVGAGTFSSALHAPIVPTPSRPERGRLDEGVAPVAERLLLLPVAVTQVPDPVGSPDKAGRRRVLKAVAPDGVPPDIPSEVVPEPSGGILG